MRGFQYRAPFVALSAAIALMGAQCSTTAPEASSVFRFTMTAGASAPSPLYVQAVGLDGQPGWLRVRHADGTRVFLTERCDVPDCGKPEVVCGASVPIVERLAAGGSATVTWDGTESIVNATSNCETRRPAPAGRYIATFCFATDADLAPGGSTVARMQGTVKSPTCNEVAFTFPGTGALDYAVP